MREYSRNDLYFLLFFTLNRPDIAHPWLFARCREVQANPNGYLDLWSRGHFKSSIITFGLTIQDILTSHGEDPDPKWGGKELTIGIFSHTRVAAKQFVAQIKREFETNHILRNAFPDIIWENPAKQSPSWSLDNGLILKRNSNPKEATVEGWGLVDGQPTGKHFDELIFDDVVTIDSVRSINMIEKTTQAWELSLNLGSKNPIKRHIGTRYSYNDTYKTILERKAAIPRIYTATVDGTSEGEPVLLSRETLAEKRRNMGIYVYNSQMMQQPSLDDAQGFKNEWLQFANMHAYEDMNRYILVDPANAKKQQNDYTVMMVLGLSPDNNFYILDIIRDRLSLTERTEMLFRLHRKFKPKCVGYEHYGMQADVAHIKDVMKRTNYNFKIIELGGNLAKVDRIRKLVPLFEEGRIYLPESCYKTNYEKKTEDLVDVFVNQEYLAFPHAEHDDMLDCLARILDEDMKLVWPKIDDEQESYIPTKRGSSWSA